MTTHALLPRSCPRGRGAARHRARRDSRELLPRRRCSPGCRRDFPYLPRPAAACPSGSGRYDAPSSGAMSCSTGSAAGCSPAKPYLPAARTWTRSRRSRIPTRSSGSIPSTHLPHLSRTTWSVLSTHPIQFLDSECWDHPRVRPGAAGRVRRGVADPPPPCRALDKGGRAG